MKIAIIHDYLNQWGGAERVVEALANIFPDAPIYTSLYSPRETFECFQKREVRTSFLQNIPGSSRLFRQLFFLYPWAFRSLGDFKDFDVVLTSTSTFAKGIAPDPSVCHISYCHSPTRFLYDFDRYTDQLNIAAFIRPLLRSMTRVLIPWDKAAAKRVHFFIANSRQTAKAIRRIYGRESRVVHPPIDAEQFCPPAVERKEDFYLVVSRLLGYKRIDLAIKACGKLPRKLWIIGDGPDQERLKDLSRGGPVQFLGHVSQKTLVELYRRARGVIFPGEEDFGLVPLEAMACGTPVIAYRGGGALESVEEGRTGIFFDHPTTQELAQGIQRFEKTHFSTPVLWAHAQKFGMGRFRDQLVAAVSECYNSFRA